MTQSARIKLTSKSLPKIVNVCDEIMNISKKTGVKMKGPVPLPIKRLNVVTRKSPCGSADDKAIRQLMRLKIPDDVYIELSLK